MQRKIHALSKRMCCVYLLCLMALGVQAPAADMHAQDRSGLIRRDQYGVPHILAKTEEAAAFAYGYATAEDHLQDLARLFLRARGEQAAVFGPAFVNEDLLVHRLGIIETARERFRDLPPGMQGILNNFAEGYDAELAQERRAGRAPEWAKPVDGVDVLAHCRAVLLLDFSLNLRPWQHPELPPGFGSNMWAIGRGFSQSGRGILLANPHLRWSGSHIFHEGPGRINISGATLIGFPVVVIGFNGFLGWSHTVNHCRSEAIYELKLNPKNHGQFFYDGRLVSFKSRMISIQVKDGSSTQTHTETELLSGIGPIIRESGDTAFAYSSANLDAVDFLTEYNRMAKAKTLKEFRDALNMQALPMFNVAYTDREGAVYYLDNCRSLVLAEGYDWTKPVPGDSSRTAWRSIEPLAELPQILNPARGYVQNCNDAPWYVAEHGGPNPANYPHYYGDETLGLRGQRGFEMLDSLRTATLENVKQLKYDEHSLLAERLKPELISLATARDSEGVLRKAVQVLSAWDNRFEESSHGAVLFHTWWELYAHMASRRFRSDWSKDHPFDTPAGIGDPQAAVTALEAAVRAIEKEYGDAGIAWGDLHRLRRGSLDVPLGGVSGMGIFGSVMYQQDSDKKWSAMAGDSYVLAVEFTNPPTAFSVMSYSESSDPESPHYTDQSTLYARQSYKRFWFTEHDIQSHAERIYHPGDPEQNEYALRAGSQ